MIGKQGVSLRIGHNGIQDKTTLSAANETVNRGIYAATTLSTVDADLAVGNIKDGVTIFGKLGTLVAGTLAEDALGVGIGITGAGSSGTYYLFADDIAAGADFDIASKVDTYDATSLAAGLALLYGVAETLRAIKVRLIMDGVQIAESAYVSDRSNFKVAWGSRALSGEVTSICRIHNYNASACEFRSIGIDPTVYKAGLIFVGSIKLV